MKIDKTVFLNFVIFCKFYKDLCVCVCVFFCFFWRIGRHAKQTRPLSDSEAATMYKLKGQSSDMRTGQGFK